MKRPLQLFIRISAALVLLNTAVSAQAPRGWDRCVGHERPDLLIEGCSEIIDEGRQAPAILAIWLKSDYVAAFYNRALAYVDKGDHGHALSDFEIVLKFNPKSALALYARGWMLLKKGDTEAGDADFVAAKAINPDIAEQFDPSN